MPDDVPAVFVFERPDFFGRTIAVLARLHGIGEPRVDDRMVFSINADRVKAVLHFFNLPLEELAEENNTAIRSRQALMLPVGYRPGGLPRHVILRQRLVCPGARGCGERTGGVR